MENLITIILRLNRYILQRIDILTNSDSTSRSAMLYQEILKGHLSDDADVAKFLSEKFDMKSATNQSNFKKVFKNHAFNTLVFLDPEHEDIDDYQKFIYKANKEFIVIRNLYEMQLSAIATEYAEELLTEVIKYEYTEMAVMLLKYIKSRYAIVGNNKKYMKFNKLLHKNKKIFDEELKAREYQELLVIQYAKSAEYKPQNSKLAKSFFKDLSPLLKENTSFSFQFNSRLVELYQYSTVTDYVGVLDVSNRAITFFESKSVKYNTTIATFLGQKMVALMYLKRYEEALPVINRTIDLRLSGTFNWFKSNESKMFLYFRMAQYESAYTLYQEVTTLKAFKTLEGLNKEMWEMFHLYFHLLHKLGFKIVTNDKLLNAEFKQNFKMNRFKNDTTTMEHDKKGLNISRLIAQMCLLIVEKQTDNIKDDGVKKYLSRYTDKKDANRRFYLFGKMLLEIIEHEYNTVKFKKNTDKLLEELKNTESDVTQPIYRAEIVELEMLWRLVLEKIGLVKSPELTAQV